MSRNASIEQTASAHRQLDGHGRLTESPSWHDLDDAGRAEAFDVAVRHRAMEAAVDPQGLSATSHLVLERIRQG